LVRLGCATAFRRFLCRGDRDAAVVMCDLRAASFGQARVFGVGSGVSACLVVVGAGEGATTPGLGVLSTLCRDAGWRLL
jgi:hypothetical protein